jgi:hypothetical protein
MVLSYETEFLIPLVVAYTLQNAVFSALAFILVHVFVYLLVGTGGMPDNKLDFWLFRVTVIIMGAAAGRFISYALDSASILWAETGEKPRSCGIFDACSPSSRSGGTSDIVCSAGASRVAYYTFLALAVLSAFGGAVCWEVVQINWVAVITAAACYALCILFFFLSSNCLTRATSQRWSLFQLHAWFTLVLVFSYVFFMIFRLVDPGQTVGRMYTSTGLTGGVLALFIGAQMFLADSVRTTEDLEETPYLEYNQDGTRIYFYDEPRKANTGTWGEDDQEIIIVDMPEDAVPLMQQDK